MSAPAPPTGPILTRWRARGRRLVDIADIAATFLFALEGASAAAAQHLDVFGILVVGFATALVGGIVRDLLLGEAPPAAFRSPIRILVALAGGLIAFAAYAAVSDIPADLLIVLDAVGLSLFAITGAAKAYDRGSGWLVVVILGTVTGVGGGVLRDILLNRVPLVLNQDIYASAAAAGALTLLVLNWALRRGRRRLRPGRALVIAMCAGFAMCLTIRLVSWALDWHLPTV